MKKLFSAIILLMLVFPGCQTKTVPPIMDVSYAGSMSDEPVLVQTISVPGRSDQAVKDAIIQATTARQWDVTELPDGRIKAQLVHRTSDSTLWFSYGNGTISIESLSYEINKETQVRKERAEPEGWIRNLHKDILELLGLLED